MLRPHDNEAHLLYDGLPHLLLTTCHDGHTTWGNRAWWEYTGFADDGTPSPDLTGIVHPDDQSLVARALATPGAFGPELDHEVRLRNIDGTYHWFRLQARGVDGDRSENVAWLITATNIDHLKVEQGQRRVLQGIIDASADCIKVLDLDARLLMMNQGGLEALDIDDFELCRNQSWPTMWDDDSHCKVNAVLDLARAGQRASFEGVAATRRGVRKWWEVSVSPLYDERGNIHRLVAISRDITEHKTAQREMADDYATLEDRVLERTRQLEEERTALDAFVAFTEAVGRETDVLSLARQAMRVVIANLTHVSAAYYEYDADRWKASAWSDDLAAEVVREIRSGIPEHAPNFAEVASRMTPLFVNGWDARANFVPSTASYGAVAFIPIVIRNRVVSLFVVGTRSAHVWSERERAIVRAVGRGLNLAVDRAEQARQLAERNSELAARVQELALRARAFGAFEVLSRELSGETHADALVRAAQRAMLSILPAGFSAYFEPDGASWRTGVQVGDARNGGPPFGTEMLPAPGEIREAHYQSARPATTGRRSPEGAHVAAHAALPVTVHGELRGVLGLAVFDDPEVWSPVVRDFLETVTRSLSLALERTA